MAISVTCPNCGKRLRAKDEYDGRQVKCPACRQGLVIHGERATPHDVFISYSNKDKATADAICAALEAKRIRCWIAPRDILPGVDWGEGIIEAINDTRLMVLVFSEYSNTSPQVRRELERAVNKDVPILPFRINDVPLSKSLEYFISTQHWLDALTLPLGQHLETLCQTAHRLLERKQNAAPLPAPKDQLPTPDNPVCEPKSANSSYTLYVLALPPLNYSLDVATAELSSGYEVLPTIEEE